LQEAVCSFPNQGFVCVELTAYLFPECLHNTLVTDCNRELKYTSALDDDQTRLFFHSFSYFLQLKADTTRKMSTSVYWSVRYKWRWINDTEARTKLHVAKNKTFTILTW